jgi:hypothetical protein
MKKLSIAVLAVLLVLTMVSSALAVQKEFIKAKPFVFDPDDTGQVVACWPGQQGLPDVGKARHALLLQKDAAAPAEVLVGVSIQGVQGRILTELGLDVRNDATITGTSPRFIVTVANGDTFLFYLAGQTPTPISGTNWGRIRFVNGDAVAQVGNLLPWPGLGTAVMKGIRIIVDQAGATDFLDNLDFNGTLIGKPGNIVLN